MSNRSLTVLLSMALIGCASLTAQIKKESRDVGSFHTVVTRGSEDVYVKQGSSPSLIIEADESIMGEIETEVRSGVLVVGLKERWFDRSWKNNRIKVYVTMPEIKGFRLSGSGEIVGETDIKTDELELNISGSGKIKMNVFAESLRSEISGSGDVLLSGEAEEYLCRISGSGNIVALDLKTRNCMAKISGAGDAKVHVSGDLEVKISGSGNIAYAGDPKSVNTQISGSGNVRKLK